MLLKIKMESECRWDVIGLGEILLRFCPGKERIETARSFEVFDGGAEYNVVRNLASAFRRRAAIITALQDNALGRLAENRARGAGVDVSEIRWRDEWRNGLYFIERGFGQRAPASCFDRADTAISNLRAVEIEWRKICAQTRWFHTGGVLTGLSDAASETAREALNAARARGAIVSYDLNYRDSLWRKKGGRDAANRLNREHLQYADVVFGLFDFDARLSRYDESEFRQKAERLKKDFPNLQIIASSLREVRTASRHDLSGVLWHEGEVYKAQNYQDCEVFDRVGSGDAFAAGVIGGILKNESAQFAIECAAACGVLAMTTAGDNLQVAESEIINLMQGGGAGVKR